MPVPTPQLINMPVPTPQPIKINENVNFKDQVKYYYRNKEKINQDPRRKEYNAKFQRLTYDEAKKEHKRQYYIMTKNYRNLNFSKDIVQLFSNPLEVV
tara:strand:+ start:103 stop:396 length:294 start_codon:yes stop_codon:yes gene_type:complete